MVGQLLFLAVVLALYRLFEDVGRNQARLMLALLGTGIAAQFAGFALNVAPLILLKGEQYFSAFNRLQLGALACQVGFPAEIPGRPAHPFRRGVCPVFCDRACVPGAGRHSLQARLPILLR